MIEIFSGNKNNITVKNTENKKIEINYESKEVKIEGLLIDMPGEYEKSSILLEAKEYEGNLFYSFLVESKVIFLIMDENFEVKEEILKFFGDIDILIIRGGKNTGKIAENIEARIIMPFGDTKDLYLNALGLHKEEIETFKIKSSDINNDETQIINIKL